MGRVVEDGVEKDMDTLSNLNCRPSTQAQGTAPTCGEAIYIGKYKRAYYLQIRKVIVFVLKYTTNRKSAQKK